MQIAILNSQAKAEDKYLIDADPPTKAGGN